MEPIKTGGGLQVSGDEDPTSEHAAVAALEQLFLGLHVEFRSLDVHCRGYDTPLGEGDQVSVYTYRTVETPRWHLDRYRCPDCAPDEITTPTLGATNTRVNACLAVVSDTGTHQHQLCLVDSTATVHTPPNL